MSRAYMIKVLRWIGIVVGILILLFQAYQGFLAFQDNDLMISNIRLFFFAIVIVMFSFILQVFSYQIILSALGIRTNYFELFRGYVTSFLPRYIPGTVWGYMARSAWLFEKYSTPFQITYLSSLIEFTIGIIALIIVIILSLVSRKTLLGSLLAGLLLFMANSMLCNLFNSILRRKPFKFIGLNLDSISSYPVKKWLSSVFLISLNMFLYSFSLYLICVSLVGSNNQSFIHFSSAFPLYFGISYLVGLVIFIFPSGLGLREASLSALLTANMGYTQQQSSGIAIAFRLCILIAELIWTLGIISHRPYNKSYKEN